MIKTGRRYNMETIYVTEAIKKKTEEKIEYLNTVRRKELSREIKEALAFGDVAENAEYLSVREEVLKMETEINELTEKLHRMVIVDESKVDRSKISMGAKILVKDLEFNEEEEFKLIGDREEHSSIQDVSISSPMGRGMLGKKEGDIVEVNAPSGTFKFKVLKVIYE